MDRRRKRNRQEQARGPVRGKKELGGVSRTRSKQQSSKHKEQA